MPLTPADRSYFASRCRSLADRVKRLRREIDGRRESDALDAALRRLRSRTPQIADNASSPNLQPDSEVTT